MEAGWYEATSVARPDRPRLNLDLDVDVCVIGAGLAGLTVAREVAQRGWSVAVLEAAHVAWAASGRNLGFVLPGYFEDIDDIVERTGLDHAKQLWALSEQGLEYVRRTILDTGMPGVDLFFCTMGGVPIEFMGSYAPEANSEISEATNS